MNEQLMGQLNPQSAAALCNLATNVKALIALGLDPVGASHDWRDQERKKFGCFMIDLLELGTQALKARFGHEFVQHAKNATPRLHGDAALKARFQGLELEGSPDLDAIKRTFGKGMHDALEQARERVQAKADEEIMKVLNGPLDQFAQIPSPGTHRYAFSVFGALRPEGAVRADAPPIDRRYDFPPARRQVTGRLATLRRPCANMAHDFGPLGAHERCRRCDWKINAVKKVAAMERAPHHKPEPTPLGVKDVTT